MLCWPCCHGALMWGGGLVAARPRCASGHQRRCLAHPTIWSARPRGLRSWSWQHDSRAQAGPSARSDSPDSLLAVGQQRQVVTAPCHSPTGPWWSALGSASQGFTDWLLIHRSEESLCYAFSSHRRHQVLAGTRRWCTDLEGHLVKSWKPLVHAAGVGSWDRPRLAATIPGTPSTCVAALSAP